MRIGYNPHKDEILADTGYNHQVIIPVYIPAPDGYFKDSLIILRFCLESLFKTIHSKTYISIINNGSNDEVVDYLNDLLSQGKIQELIHSTNIGKLNAVLKGLSGHRFPLVTIADSDVMFLNNWQQETYRVFEAFPKAGAVCPTPSSKSYKTYTSNIWFEMLFSKSMQFTKVKNPKALQHFADSINNPHFYNEYHLDQYLTVTKNNCTAVVGAGHYLVTYKGSVFENLLYKYSDFKLGGDSEKEILDIPVVKNGLWRLSTQDNFAYHMGNVYEDWMDSTMMEVKQQQSDAPVNFDYKKGKTSTSEFFVKYKLFTILLSKKALMVRLLKMKGLSSVAAKNY